MQPRCLRTIEDRSDRFPVIGIGNAWSREHFDGPFYLHRAPPGYPAISLVFVQSRDGNTGAPNPDDLGGGPTDKQLIYEGLSRAAADAVMSGAGSAGHSAFYTIHQPEIVALRLELGFPRHPAQIVMSNSGNVDLSARLFTTPDVRVFLLAGDRCIEKVGGEIARRPWITMLGIGGDLRAVFARLRHEYGIGRISSIGGRHAATSLVDAGLVQDLYLTTSAIDGGEPNTPWYVGARVPRLDTIVSKREVADATPIAFGHFALRA